MEKRSVFWKVGITAVFAVAMALYWYFARPWIIEHQYSIAHFDTIGTFGDALKSVGGLAAFIGSFLQSLFQSPTAGALVQTLVLAVPLQMLVWQNMEAKNDALFLQSFIPSVLLLWITGDRDVLVAFPVALIISLLVAMLMGRKQLFADLVIAPLLYWLLGSAAWVYVLVRIVHCNWRKSWWMAVYMVVAQVLLWLVCKMLNPGMLIMPRLPVSSPITAIKPISRHWR